MVRYRYGRSSIHIWYMYGLWYQEQGSSAAIRNDTRQFTVGCDYLCKPQIPASACANMK